MLSLPLKPWNVIIFTRYQELETDTRCTRVIKRVEMGPWAFYVFKVSSLSPSLLRARPAFRSLRARRPIFRQSPQRREEAQLAAERGP